MGFSIGTNLIFSGEPNQPTFPEQKQSKFHFLFWSFLDGKSARRRQKITLNLRGLCKRFSTLGDRGTFRIFRKVRHCKKSHASQTQDPRHCVHGHVCGVGRYPQRTLPHIDKPKSKHDAYVMSSEKSPSEGPRENPSHYLRTRGTQTMMRRTAYGSNKYCILLYLWNIERLESKFN